MFLSLKRTHWSVHHGASLTFDNLNKPVVTLQFNNIGAKIFEDITGGNVGKPLAIFMDDN